MKSGYLSPILLMVFVMITSCQTKDKLLYQSETYSVYRDSVRWKNDVAVAVSLREMQSTYTGNDSVEMRRWTLQNDISHYPAFRSGILLVDALYNLSLDELEMLKTDEGLLDTGAEWTGVWTRDMSYSILLSLAYFTPDIAKKCLMEKVKDGKIIQDTGSGGSWPVSSDRTTWVLAAWEVYKVTGDREWLNTIYPIIKQSVDTDMQSIYYGESLALGESSFLDWREQSYPQWMQPTDIYRSENLGTNVVHYQTAFILSQMAELQNEDAGKYAQLANRLKEKINAQLWLESKGYYAQYRYGRAFLSVSPRAEALGEALSVLFEVAPPEKQQQIVENTPVAAYGVPCFSPQIPDMQPYHNNGVWPFVQAYYNWAAAKTNNTKAVEHGLAALYRAAAIFLTNKENMVAETGLPEGTAINSDRQLWSVAGNIAMAYRVFFGMHFHPEFLEFRPFVPQSYGGSMKIEQFPYRNALLTIELKGYGSEVAAFRINGETQTQARIPASATGRLAIEIELNNQLPANTTLNLQEVVFAPATPLVSKQNNQLTWPAAEGAARYEVHKNGQLQESLTTTTWQLPPCEGYTEYQVKSIAENGRESFLSQPVVCYEPASSIVVEAETLSEKSTMDSENYSGTGFLLLSKTDNTQLEIPVEIPESGSYLLRWRYANGNGPVCCDNQCAIRTLYLNNQRQGIVVMPQRGNDNWTEWGWSNYHVLRMEKGKNVLGLQLAPPNENMNGTTNRALLDYLEVVKME